MAEHRIYLSPSFQEQRFKSNFVFFNDVDKQLARCTRKIRVRLLSFYSPIDLPPSHLYIEGVQRRTFGAFHSEDYFPLPRIEGGKRHEDCHLYTGKMFTLQTKSIFHINRSHLSPWS